MATTTRADPARPRRGLAGVLRLGEVAASRSVAAEGLTLIGLSGLAVLAYALTKAPLYNPVGTIDPWLYTAAWTNFNLIYHAFSTTYYLSRLPWIVPGYALNKFLGPEAAYFVIHLVFFFGAALLLYVVCRRYFGRVAAACGYVALIGNQLYFNAHRWDYEEGAVLAFMIASFAFAIPKRRTPRVRAFSLLLSGFFGAALTTTRIVDTVYLIGLPLVYWAVMVEDDRHHRARRVAIDIVWFLAGGCALLIVGGLFAHRHGGEFLFFMPQIRVMLQTTGEANQVPVHEWFPTEPYFFVPIFVTLLSALLLLIGRPSAAQPRRLLVASTAWLGVSFAGIALWEFAGTGWIFELSYYFSSFVVPSVFCVTGCVAGLLEGIKGMASRVLALALAAIAVLVPLLWFYRSDSPLRAAHGVWHGAYLTTLVIMVIGVVLALVVWITRSRLACVATVAIAVLGVSYGVDASQGVLVDATSDSRTPGLYDVGQKTIRYLNTHGFSDQLPTFWYDVKYENSLYGSLQSLYYYGYTYVANELPKIDETFRSRMRLFRPAKLVLLCAEPSCAGASAALDRAGYRSAEIRRRRLESRGVHVWVVIRSIKTKL